MVIKAYAATEAAGELKAFEYDPGILGDEEVEIRVEYCGICHSDLSMLDNQWGMTSYPFVPGHEIVGKIEAMGTKVKHLQLGQQVGLGWFSRSCLTCQWCLSGNQNLCQTAESTIVGRHGGFADKVRANQTWVIPLPEGVNPITAGPLFCGGITVFNPIIQYDIKPTERVGVIGIGGLGHMALRFLHSWGCEVTAFSSNPDKEAEAKELGANHFVNSRDPELLKTLVNSFDVILSTVNVDLDWDMYISLLRPLGRLHLVGAVLKPLSLSLFPILTGQKSISASPLGSPVTITQMLDFSARHGIEPMVEVFPMEQVNQAISRLREGKARYRIVLKNS
jgi:uncharacterized zinc-type alcohol dehydrogenase-like protein